MKYETELGMKQTILSIKIQDEVLRLNELRELLKSRAREKSTILCLEEDIITLHQSQEDSSKQLLA